MITFKITLAYDGTGFVGWQRQASGVSIQGIVEEALTKLAGESVKVAGAGRTDAGVHALAQVASFTLERDIDTRTVVRAANARLPPAIRVIDAERVPHQFHARFSARSKTYRYRFWNGPILDPFERAYAWHVIDPLDATRMDAAARQLEGVHDFAAFQAAGNAVRSTERELSRSRVSRLGALLIYEVEGTGFLRHMVRNIAGSLVEIGRGRRDDAWLTDVMASRRRSAAGPTAPAAGLFLLSVGYDPPSARLAAEP